MSPPSDGDTLDARELAADMTADELAGIDDSDPPWGYPNVLTPEHQLQQAAMVADIHAALVYVRTNLPPVLAAMNDNPMLKMMFGKLFQGDGDNS